LAITAAAVRSVYDSCLLLLHCCTDAYLTIQLSKSVREKRGDLAGLRVTIFIRVLLPTRSWPPASLSEARGNITKCFPRKKKFYRERVE
jgi:hypothetical protein